MEMDLAKPGLDMQQNNRLSSAPYLAVYMVTYNHEPFIVQAIDGVMMQQTDFSVKLFIGDDASTDNTASICKTYKAKFPGRIELLLHPENLGGVQNAKLLYEACFASGATYIAMCEGDDYWTDPYKLQKQVDLLDANPQFALCFHEADVLNTNTGERTPYAAYTQKVYTTEDILKTGSFVPTLSIVFRTKGLVFPDWYFRISFGDITLLLMVSLLGDVALIREKMGVYRWHDKGMARQLEANQIQLALESVKLLHYFNMYTKFAYDGTVQAATTETLYRLKHYERYQNLRDTRSLPKKLISTDFWQRKAKELKIEFIAMLGKPN